MQFNNFYFRFDGLNSRDKNLVLVTVDGLSQNNQNGLQFGVNKTIAYSQNSNDISSIDIKPLTIPVTIMKLDGYGIPMPYEPYELDEICRWLFQDEFKPFISFDDTSIVSYVMFTQGNNFKNSANEGCLNLTMTLSDGYAYTHQKVEYVRVTGSKVIEVINNSNFQRFVYPDIEFELIGDNTNLSIKNLDFGESMDFTGLEKNEHIYCYNDGLKYVESKVDKTRILNTKFNDKWIKLHYGKNRIKVTGDCIIKIITQCPIALN